MILGLWRRGHKQHMSFSNVHRMQNQYVKTDHGMDQRVIVAYLSLKRFSTRVIHEDLKATIGPDALVYSTVTRYLHDAYCSSLIAEATSIEIQRGLDDSDRSISFALEKNLFASVRQFSCLTHILATTMYHRLTKSLGFTVRHLRWVPHTLSLAQKAQRIEFLQ
jgi:hypothetical protein